MICTLETVISLLYVRLLILFKKRGFFSFASSKVWTSPWSFLGPFRPDFCRGKLTDCWLQVTTPVSWSGLAGLCQWLTVWLCSSPPSSPSRLPGLTSSGTRAGSSASTAGQPGILGLRSGGAGSTWELWRGSQTCGGAGVTTWSPASSSSALSPGTWAGSSSVRPGTASALRRSTFSSPSTVSRTQHHWLHIINSFLLNCICYSRTESFQISPPVRAGSNWECSRRSRGDPCQLQGLLRGGTADLPGVRC